MLKTMTLRAMAVGALAAFVAPTAASAQRLTEDGTSLKVGAEVTAISVDLLTTGASQKELACDTVTIHAEVTANGKTTSAAKSTGVMTEGCRFFTTLTFLIHEVTFTETSFSLHFEKANESTATTSFTTDIGEPIFATCSDASTAVGLKLTYAPETSSFGVEGPLAGPCGESLLHGVFTLETSDGTPIVID